MIKFQSDVRQFADDIKDKDYMISQLLELGQAEFFIKGFKTSKIGAKYA